MRALLDTHVLLWAARNPDQLSRQVAIVIADEANEMFVSVVSAFEIATKVRLGKLPEAETLEREFVTHVLEAGYSFLPIDVERRSWQGVWRASIVIRSTGCWQHRPSLAILC